MWAALVQTFDPVISQPPSTRCARLRTAAKSEPSRIWLPQYHVAEFAYHFADRQPNDSPQVHRRPVILQSPQSVQAPTFHVPHIVWANTCRCSPSCRRPLKKLGAWYPRHLTVGRKHQPEHGLQQIAALLRARQQPAPAIARAQTKTRFQTSARPYKQQDKSSVLARRSIVQPRRFKRRTSKDGSDTSPQDDSITRALNSVLNRMRSSE
ncbi:MAG: hypothetical protein RL585_588 [Pseudomonadota bacterium]